MERIMWAVAVTLALAAGAAAAQDNKGDKKKEAAPAELGPFGLPTLASVKEKCKPTADQAPKLEAVYADATKNEADTRKRAREQATEKKDLDKFLAMGKNDAINKVKDLLDEAQKKIFNSLVVKTTPDPKKK